MSSIYKSLKIVFWDMPVGLNKLSVRDYGSLGFFLGMSFYTPLFGLLITFFYLFQTDNLYSPIPSLLKWLLGAYYFIPLLLYCLWKFTDHWLRKKYPKLHRFSVRRWAELLVVFIYFNTIIGIITSLF